MAGEGHCFNKYNYFDVFFDVEHVFDVKQMFDVKQPFDVKKNV